MDIIEIIMIQLGFIILFFNIWLIRSLIIKNKRYKEIVRKQSEYLLTIYESVNLAEQKIIEIDSQGIFQGDDEVGFYFQLIKSIQKQIFEYTKFIQ